MWKDIPGFEGRYKINTDGRVFSYLSNRCIKATLNKGYYVIGLVPSFKTKKQYKLHRLLMMTFNPIPNMDSFVVDHIDCNGENNNLSNLRWCTSEQNSRYAALSGLMNSKLSKDIVIEILNRLSSKSDELSMRQFNLKLSKEFNIPYRTVESITNRSRWKHIQI